MKPRCNANACRPFNEPTTAKQIDFQPFMTTGSMLLKKFYSPFRDRHWCYINYIHKHSLRVKFILSLRAVILLIAASRLSFNIKIVSVVVGGWCLFVCAPFFPLFTNSSRQSGARLSEKQLTSKAIAITICGEKKNWMWSLLDTVRVNKHTLHGSVQCVQNR